MPMPAQTLTSVQKSTRDILSAARKVRNSLGAGAGVLKSAIQTLDDVARDQTGATAFREYFLRETAGPSSPERLATTNEALAMALSEIEIGNVLIASGQATNEVVLGYHQPDRRTPKPPLPTPPPHSSAGSDKADGTETSPAPAETDDGANPTLSPPAETPDAALNVAIARLERASENFSSDAVAVRRSFTAVAPAESAGAIDFKSFGELASTTLSSIVSEAAKTIRSMLTEFEKLGFDRITKALGSLGERLPNLGSIGRLIQLGVERVKSAVEWLLDLLGPDLLASARKQVQDVWDKLKSGQAASSVLEWIYDIPGTRKQVDDILTRSDLLKEKLVANDTDLKALTPAFRADMELARTIATGVAVTGGLLAMIPIFGGNAILVAAGLDALLLAVVVIMGSSCTAEGLPLSNHRGVLRLVRELEPGSGLA
jgi:hypothetical protein